MNTPVRAVPKTRRSLYSILNSQKNFEFHSKKTVGHLLAMKQAKKNKPNFQNTCGFDALVASMCIIVSDTENENLIKDENENFKYLINLLNTVGYISPNSKCQQIKDEILSKVMKVSSNLYSIINCDNNISFFVEKVIKTGSYTIQKTCPCDEGIKKSIPFIYLNMKSEKEVSLNFKNLKLDVVQKNKCRLGHIYNITYNFGNIIFIQVTFLTPTALNWKKFH